MSQQDFGDDDRYCSEPSTDDLASPAMDDGPNENFKVAIRVRPPVERELRGPRQFVDVARIPSDHKSITLCEHLDVDDGRGGVYSTQSFTFDHVYDPSAKQQYVYERSARSAVQSVLHGYNATLIAYGQTGTGKTYTMEGFTNNENRGIIPRATEEIFSYIQTCKDKNMKFLVRASYLQIYNEVISDLLKPLNKQLVVRHTKQRGVFIEGLSEWVVRSPNDVYGLMERGCSLRATGSTKMSELSSRSHAMFIIIVEVMEGDENHPQSYKYGKLNIVDLAGSEKVRQTGVTGVRLEETKKINWSLHELGNVIAALTDSKRRDRHIPFRNSCLTRVLQDSLGGNCKTTLIACISPALDAYSESLSTLKFANRAKNIKNEATINEDVDQGALLQRYEKELHRLRKLLQERGGHVDPSMDDFSDGRRAEDHRAALLALESKSREMEVEMVTRRRLEGRINELETLLGDGTGSPLLSADEYALRLDELDRERQVMEEDKAQVDRYKQLLLKQRDVMLNLTTRLNERDETILHLQEEIDAYDAHIQMLEDAMDASLPSFSSKTDAENHLSRMRVKSDGTVRFRSEGNSEHLLSAEEKIVELLMLKGREGNVTPSTAADDEKRAMNIVLRDRLEVVAQRVVRERCHKLEWEIEHLKTKLHASEARCRTAEMAAQGPDVASLRKAIEHEGASLRHQSQQRIQQLSSDLDHERDRLQRLSTEMDTIRVQFSEIRHMVDAPQRSQIDRLQRTIASLEDEMIRDYSPLSPQSSPAHFPEDVSNEIASLKKKTIELQSKISQHDSEVRSAVAAAVSEKEKEMSQISRSLTTHVKDRRALRTILESRIKVKVDLISENIAQMGDRQRLMNEVRALQNLVNASVAAMESGDA